MSTESITRKQLPDITAHDVSLVCVMDNLIVLEFDDTRRISFALELLDLAVAEAKLSARKKELQNRAMELAERFRQSNEPAEAPNF